jgi:Rrf2 family protein
MRRDSRLSMSLHVLLHLSGHRGPITSEALSEHMGANPVVIRRTMAGLRKAGLVSSSKGHGGGWSISRDLKEISLLDIYRALDEPILVQQNRGIEMPECLVEQTVGHALDGIYQEAEALIIKSFDKIKLSDLSTAFHARLAERSGRAGKRRSHPSLAMLEL